MFKAGLRKTTNMDKCLISLTTTMIASTCRVQVFYTMIVKCLVVLMFTAKHEENLNLRGK